MFLGGPVSWASRRQSCVAMSTTEAEFIAAAEAVKEAIWLQLLLKELGIPQNSTELKCDNQAAIALVRNPVCHQRTKHMDVRFFFIREAEEDKKIKITYISSNDQLADIFTKSLPNSSFSKLREMLNVTKIPMQERP